LKVGVECAFCTFQRGYMEILEATEDEIVRIRAIRSLFKLLSENFKPTTIPSELGTMRERLIKEVTGNPDPLAEKKRMSNAKAMEVLPYAERLISVGKSPIERFRKACLCAIVGNIIEFNIPDHTISLDELGELIRRAEEDLAIDNIDEAFSILEDSSLVLYLTDNAGEIALDTLLVREMRGMGKRVVVAVKDRPVCNDATLEDAIYVGMDKVASALITIGTDTMGLSLKECSDEFLKYYNSADLVIAKGMGYAESITEIKRLRAPHLLLLRTKCKPIAKFFGVERNRNIAKILR